jgi:hypothetical protein
MLRSRETPYTLLYIPGWRGDDELKGQQIPERPTGDYGLRLTDGTMMSAFLEGRSNCRIAAVSKKVRFPITWFFPGMG